MLAGSRLVGRKTAPGNIWSHFRPILPWTRKKSQRMSFCYFPWWSNGCYSTGLEQWLQYFCCHPYGGASLSTINPIDTAGSDLWRAHASCPSKVLSSFIDVASFLGRGCAYVLICLGDLWFFIAPSEVRRCLEIILSLWLRTVLI